MTNISSTNVSLWYPSVSRLPLPFMDPQTLLTFRASFNEAREIVDDMADQ